MPWLDGNLNCWILFSTSCGLFVLGDVFDLLVRRNGFECLAVPLSVGLSVQIIFGYDGKQL